MLYLQKLGSSFQLPQSLWLLHWYGLLLMHRRFPQSTWLSLHGSQPLPPSLSAPHSYQRPPTALHLQRFPSLRENKDQKLGDHTIAVEKGFFFIIRCAQLSTSAKFRVLEAG